jgi:hypothetical protein
VQDREEKQIGQRAASICGFVIDFFLENLPGEIQSVNPLFSELDDTTFWAADDHLFHDAVQRRRSRSPC